MGGLACPLEARYGGPDMGGLASPLGPFKRGAWLALWAPDIALWAPDIGGLIWSLLFLTGPCDGGPTGLYYGGLAS